MRGMSKWEREYEAKGVAFLAVNAFEPLERAQAFVKKTDLHYTWLRADPAALKALGISAIPSQIILDKAGNVAWTSSLASLTQGADGVKAALDEVLAK